MALGKSDFRFFAQESDFFALCTVEAEMRLRLAGGLLGMLILGYGAVLDCGAALGQSHDQNHPTPLAPGVNKGNVDSIVGPDYWYFNAVPGPVQVHLAFHEMGLFGNPYRQKANFDIIYTNGKIGHMEITSQGNTATYDHQGEFHHPERLILRVTGQSNLIRMGGYYEITFTGGVAFDGKAGSTAGVKAKESESLVHNVGPLVQSSGPLVKSGGPLVKPAGDGGAGSGSLVHSSGGPLVKSSGPLVYPGKPLIVHETQHEVRITLAADVLFDFGKSQIRSDAEKTLREAATKTKFAHAVGPIRVEGFTDAKGSAQVNQRLSAARANAVEDWMIRNAGFSAQQLEPKGFGAARPVAANAKPDGSDNPAGRQLNRRVEIVVTR